MTDTVTRQTPKAHRNGPDGYSSPLAREQVYGDGPHRDGQPPIIACRDDGRYQPRHSPSDRT